MKATRPGVLVVGAGGAIGGSVAARLARDGYSVWAADLAAHQDLVAALPGDGHRAVAMDVSDDESVRDGVQVFWDNSTPGGLVYAAGLVATGPLAGLEWDDYDALMQVNLRGAFRVGRVVSGLVGDGQHNLSMVFVSSVAGLQGESGGTVYCATKFGLIGLVQSLAAELAPRGVRINTVCPGNVDSPMLRQLAEAIADEQDTSTHTVLTELARASAFERLISPDEVAEVCGFLISPRSSGVSGQTVVVDGPPTT